MPLSRCVPVVFNQELVNKTRHELPKRKIIHYSMSWCSIILRLLAMLALFFLPLFSLASYTDKASFKLSIVIFFHCIVSIVDFLLLAVFGDMQYSENENSQDIRLEFKIFTAVRSSFALAYTVCIYVFSSFYITYAAVALSSLVMECVLSKLRQRYYFRQSAKFAKLLIADIEEVVGLDNCVSSPITTDFRDYEISEEKLWNGVVIDVRDTTINPSCGIMKVNKGWLMFVSWTSYITITNRIKDDCTKIDDLTTRNKGHRIELLAQNERIVELRTTIYGPSPYTADINMIPLCPNPVQYWSAEKARGLFVSLGGDISAYVRFQDFKQLAVHAALIRKSVLSLDLERRQLSERLQKRKQTIDMLFVTLLNCVKEEQSRRHDVRIQMEH